MAGARSPTHGGNGRSRRKCRPGPNRRGKPGFHAELVEDMFQMLLHCARADAQSGANLNVGVSASNAGKDVGFAARQADVPESGNGGGFIHAPAPFANRRPHSLGN